MTYGQSSEKEHRPEFSQVLSILRNERGIRLKDLAEKAGIQLSNLSAIHAGRKHPSDEVVLALAEALGLDKGSDEWKAFFDAAAREDQLAADLKPLCNNKSVVQLLRAIKDADLDDDDIEFIRSEIESDGRFHGRRSRQES